MRVRLGVNVDHVATLRQARRTPYPDPAEAALLAERAGADQITVHLREDRRHIQDRDLEVLRKVVTTVLNLEMAATQEMARIALEHRPDTVTLVPERRQELTTEGGLDVASQKEQLKPLVKLLTEGEIRVSLFIDPDLDQVRASHRLAVSAIELNTGRYAESRTASARREELGRIENAAKMAKKLGLEVAAGHGLHYHNVEELLQVAEIAELNIGHAIVARAVIDGLEKAVRDMRALMSARAPA